MNAKLLSKPVWKNHGLNLRWSLLAVVLMAAVLMAPLLDPVSAQEVIAHWKFDEPSGVVALDSSGEGNNGTILGAVERVAGLSGGALTFTEFGQKVEVPHQNQQNPQNNALTMEAIVRPAGPQAFGRFVTLITKNFPGTRNGYSLFVTVDNRVYAFFGDGPTRSIVAQTPLPVGEWSHVAATFDGLTSRIYINHVLDVERSNVDSLLPSTRPIELGGGDSSTRDHFNGSIDEIRISGQALLPEQQLPFATENCLAEGDFEEPLVESAWHLTGIGNANQVSAELIDIDGDQSLALTSDGATAYYGADNAGFLYQEVVGDFRLEATIDSTTMVSGKEWRKAGLMVRASLDHFDLRLLAMLAPEQQRLQFVARESYGSPGNVKVALEVPHAPAVVTLAIERSAQILTVQYSLDGGVTWITPETGLGGSIDIAALPETLLVGLATVSNNISVTTTATFDDVSICQPVN